MTTLTSLKLAQTSANPAEYRTDKTLLPTAFDWNTYKETTSSMTMFRKRQLQFAYIGYDHWLNPGNMEPADYEEALIHSIDEDE